MLSGAKALRLGAYLESYYRIELLYWRVYKEFRILHI